MTRGEEIFAKDCLSIKSLKKMDKGELISTLEINLSSLVEYYYEDFHHKEEHNFRPFVIDLVMSKKLFLKPVLKIVKESEDVVPEGLAFLVWDCLNQARHMINNKITAEQNSQKPAEEIKTNVDELKALYAETIEEAMNLLEVLSAKNIKKLKKIGMKKEFASIIAPSLLSPEYVSGKNMFRFVNLITRNLYNVAKSAIKTEDDHDVYTSGVEFDNSKTIRKIFDIMTKDMDISTYAEVIRQLLLEKRDRNFDNLDSHQLAVYNAITDYALSVLENKDIFSGKTRIEIIKAFMTQRHRDEKRGVDAKRRVSFADLNEDDYPRIIKAFKKVVKD